METTVPTMEPRLSQHPISATFPELSDDEFKLLKDDIEAHGQKYPILIYDGQILDGSHRYKACLELGIEPKLEEFTGSDPVNCVVSLNLRRRHLNESQRGMIAAALANLDHGGDRRSAQIKGSRDPLNGGSCSIAEAAEKLDVGPATVKRAKFVQVHGTPEIVDAVRTGQMSVATAARQITTDSSAPSTRPIVPVAPRRRNSNPRVPLDQRVVNAIKFTNKGIESLAAFVKEPHTPSQAKAWRLLIRRLRRALEKVELRLGPRRKARS